MKYKICQVVNAFNIYIVKSQSNSVTYEQQFPYLVKQMAALEGGFVHI